MLNLILSPQYNPICTFPDGFMNVIIIDNSHTVLAFKPTYLCKLPINLNHTNQILSIKY